ncbi:lysine N(6)-hydroxylase/L-ornithine N(5)-oxygenase family protein [Psychromicrobium lacuslunae]|uniref:lysine N(6)-hydroxylase/L-ornithine N(5)-oxygenase family protein n=1 Tax=Psychromicrobium lacuslunae TaxID=1618207 RepID=UPI000B2C33DE|nr:SidA/IucD/PvdA family monooxygenase [Psychromicrobium lacuslunae]
MRHDVFDVVGVGMGPSNLAFATAVDEHNETAAEGDRIEALFLEQKDSFGWHPGMLLEGSTMQISYLKDLATLRNPRSRFTFVNYLQQAGRLIDFINHQTFFPSRIEFADYLQWVAASINSAVKYQRTVIGIEALAEQDRNGARYRISATGPEGTEEYLTRSVIVATGLAEKLPSWATAGPRLFHNHRLLEHLDKLGEATENRFLVLGSGQSAAEVVQHLHRSYPEAVVESAFNSFGFSPADDSPFANRVFDPSAVDDFFYAPDDVRAELINRHRSTNYSCVDLELINELYAIEYRERVQGPRRLIFRPGTEVLEAVESDAAVSVTLHDRIKGQAENQRYDAVVCATGFNSQGVSGLLRGVGILGNQTPSFGRDYELLLDGVPVTGLFVQGPTESTHGLTSTLLSNVAVRGGELLNSVLALREQHGAPAASSLVEQGA